MVYQIMPDLTAEEYAALKADIALRGVQVPIEYDDQGNILDGHHRVRACHELGIKDWPSIVRVGLSEEQKRTHALALNLYRRHMTQEARGPMIMQLRSAGLSLRQIAEKAGVSHVTVLNDLRSTGKPLPVEAPERIIGKDGKSHPAQKGIGKRSCPDCHYSGYDWAPADDPPDNRLFIQCPSCGYVMLRNKQKGTAVMAKSQRDAKMAFDALAGMDTDALPDKMIDAKRATRLSREYQAQERAKDAPARVIDGSVTLVLGDFREKGKDIADVSVDLIFTDPPYPREFLPLWSDLSLFAARVLKPKGMLVAYTGALDLPEVMVRLSECLQYWWCGAIVMPGAHSRVHARQVVQGVKPLLFYVRPEGTPGTWFEDSYQSEGEQKGEHDWQQSIGAAMYYIERLCPVDGMVVDPFLGGGTTGLASKLTGRSFVGIEIDPVAFMTSQERIANGRLEKEPEG